MSMSDPIADMLIRIRNAQLVGHTEVAMPASKLKASIAQVLKDEGYIEDFALREAGGNAGAKKELRIGLKYYAGRPVIERLERVSKPGLRVPRPQRHSARDERARRRDPVDVARRHDRPQGARRRRGRRSALHRGLASCPGSQNIPCRFPRASR
jgi:ribosomal protein S8